MFVAPPPIDASFPVAVFERPPATEAPAPAELSLPPPTEAYSPEAVLAEPPATTAKLALLMPFLPPHTAEPSPLAVLS